MTDEGSKFMKAGNGFGTNLSIRDLQSPRLAASVFNYRQAASGKQLHERVGYFGFWEGTSEGPADRSRSVL